MGERLESTAIRGWFYDWRKLAIAGYALLTWAVCQAEGHYHPLAVTLALAAFAALAASLHPAFGQAAERKVSEALLLALAAVNAIAFVNLKPGLYLQLARIRGGEFIVLSVALLGLVASYFVPWTAKRPLPLTMRRARTVLLFLVAAAFDEWILHASPSPSIDVFYASQQAARRFLAGEPVYGGYVRVLDTHSFGRIIDAYAYPPLYLALASGAVAVTGDNRWAGAGGVLIAAALLHRIARRSAGPDSAVPDLFAVCLLFHPRVLFVLEQDWGEPVALPFIAGFVLLHAVGREIAAAVALGLFLATKQYLVLFLPFAALLPGRRLARVVVAGAVAVGTFVPAAITNFAGLWSDVIVHHLKNPFRADSLSMTAFLHRLGTPIPGGTGLAVALFTMARAWRLARRLGPLVLAGSLCMGLFFFFGKQAFLNYYFLIQGIWLIGLAAGWGDQPET
jgi:hypothetical protein